MNNKGYSVAELIIVVAIFLIITSAILFSQNRFSSDTNLTNSAYGVAIAVRKAQVYGLSVRGQAGGSAAFNAAFGMSFNTTSPDSFVFFSDTHPSSAGDGRYTIGSDTLISTFKLENGTTISGICTAQGASCVGVSRADVSFKRPNPEAIIKDTSATSRSKVEVSVSSALQDKTKKVIITETGQIYIQ